MHLRPSGIPHEQRAAIFEWVEARNFVTGQLARRFFPGGSAETSRKKASRWLAKRRKRKRIRVRGAVYLNAVGRPHVVYGRRRKHAELEHEVWVTEAELQLGVEFTRDVPVGETVADGSFVKDGSRFWVEVDNHTMRGKQMEEKWSRYGEVDGYILVICHTMYRLRKLMRGVKSVKPPEPTDPEKPVHPVKAAALFTLFRWLDSPTLKEPWIDCERNRTRV